MSLFDSSPFIKACRGEYTSHVPVWFMRQAGRYQPEYREVRKQYSLEEICRNPKVCFEVSKLPVQQLGVDAAILFSDIMIPIGAMGLPFEIKENVGPIVDTPIRTMADVDKLNPFQVPAKLPYVMETLNLLKSNLTVPTIGFTGAPFTLASYMIEGGPSRSYLRTKQMMWGDTQVWNALINKLADMIIIYLTAQVEAGAAAVQVFDSWVGSLTPRDYTLYLLPAMKRIFEGLAHLNVPLIYFGGTTGELLPLMAQTGATVVGVDYRVPLRDARQRVGLNMALQGNLDSAILFAPWSEIERRTREILDEGLDTPGFIFNLGQSLIHNNPPVDVGTLQRLTQFVHDYSTDKLAHQRAHRGV